MPRAYSMDLRERVFNAWAQGQESQAAVAQRFGVSESLVRDLSRRRRETGTLAAKGHGGGQRPGLDEAGAKKLRALVKERADDTILEHAANLAAAGAPRLSRSALGRWLLRLGLTRKKRPCATTSPKPSASKPCARPSKRR